MTEPPAVGNAAIRSIVPLAARKQGDHQRRRDLHNKGHWLAACARAALVAQRHQYLPLPYAAAPPQKLCAATEGKVTAWTTLSDVTRANAQAPLL
jgi:hypothetical protein